MSPKSTLRFHYRRGFINPKQLSKLIDIPLKSIYRYNSKIKVGVSLDGKVGSGRRSGEK